MNNNIDNNSIKSNLEQKLKATNLSENEIKEIVPEILKLIDLKENVENNQTESTTQNFLLDLRQDITNNSNVSIDIKRNKWTVIWTMNFNETTNNISIIINNKPSNDKDPKTEIEKTTPKTTDSQPDSVAQKAKPDNANPAAPEIQLNNVTSTNTQPDSVAQKAKPDNTSPTAPEIQLNNVTSTNTQPDSVAQKAKPDNTSPTVPEIQLNNVAPEDTNIQTNDQPDIKLDSYEWYDKALSQLIFEIEWCASTAKYKRWLNKSWKETLKTAKAKLKQYKDIISDKKRMLEHEFKQKNKLNAKNPGKAPLTVSISASEINWLKRRRNDRRKSIEEDIKAGQRGESSNIAPWPNQSLEQINKWNNVDRHHIEYDSKLNEALQDAAFLRIIDNNQDKAREFLQAIANNSLSDAQITICQTRMVQLSPYFEQYGLTDQVHRCIQTRGWRYTQNVNIYWNIDWETAYKIWWVTGRLNNTLIKAFPNAKPDQVSSFTNLAVAAGWIYAIYRIWKRFFGKNKDWERNLLWKTALLASGYFVPQLLLWKDWYSLLWEILSWKADFWELWYRASNCLWFMNNGSPEVYAQMAPWVLWMSIFPQNYTVKDIRALQQTFSDQNTRRQWYTVTYNRLNKDNSALANEFKNTFNANQYNENERKVFLAKLWITENTSENTVIFSEASKLTDKKTSLELWMKSQWKKRNPVFEKEIDNYLKQGWEFNPNDLKDKEDSWFIPDAEATYTENKDDIDFKKNLINQIDTLSIDDNQKSKLKIALQRFYDERNIGSKPLISDFSLKMENNLLILKSHKWQEAKIDINNNEIPWFWNGVRFSDLSELLNVADLSNKILETQKWKQPMDMPPFQYKIGKWGRWIYFNDAEGWNFNFDTRVLSGGRGWAMWKIDTLSNHPEDFAKYLSNRWIETNKHKINLSLYPTIKGLSESWITFINEQEVKQAEVRLNKVKDMRSMANGWTQWYKPFSIEWNKLVFSTSNTQNATKLYFPDVFPNSFTWKSQNLSNFPTILNNKDKFLNYMNDKKNWMRWSKLNN